MYNKGDLQITDPPCPDSVGDCKAWPEYGHEHMVYDQRSYEYLYHPSVYLPHSCNEWVIGGAENIKAMIEDLTAALKIMEGEKSEEDNLIIPTQL